MTNATVNQKKQKLIYVTSTDYYRSHVDPYTGELGQYGANIYDIDGDENQVVLFAMSGKTGARLPHTKTCITRRRYDNVVDFSSKIAFHESIMEELGFM